MKREELQERLTKVNEKISKLEKKISKLEAKRDSDAEFEKEYRYYSSFYTRREELKQDWINECKYNIKCAKSDLEDAKTLSIKYQNLLLIAEEKESKPVVKIFKDFFDNWKRAVIKQTTELYEHYKKIETEKCNLYNNRYSYIRDSGEENYNKELRRLKLIESEYLENGWVRKMYDSKHYSSKSFEEIVDKYMEDRYTELVDKVTKYVGEITDVNYLEIGNDGSLNGKIIGSEGKCKIETIVAGGYNIQCLHYRVIIKSIR